MTSEQFFEQWTHELSHDFKVGGQPATFYPGHPERWGTEDILVRPPKQVDTQFPFYRSLKMAVSDDRTLLAIGASTDIFIYDIATLTISQTIPYAHPGNAESMEFQPGSNRILAVSSSAPSEGGRIGRSTIRLWDLERELTQPRSFPDMLEQALKSGSQAIINSMSDWPAQAVAALKLEERLRPVLFAVQEELDLGEHRAFVGSLSSYGDSFSHDGSYMLYIEQRIEVVVFDVETRSERCRLVGHTDAIMWAGSSPDSTLIATSSWDRTVRLWSATSGEHVRTFVGAGNQLWAGAFSPDGKLISAGCGDKHARVWRVETGELLYTFDGFTDWVRGLAFSPDNQKLAAGGGGGTLRVFDLGNGECVQHWQVKMMESRMSHGFIEIRGVQYTSKGLLVFQSTDGRVFTYDERTNRKGQYEHDSQTKGSSGGSVTVTRDGGMLFISCFDNSVRGWDI
ncbi:wd-40 repeat protein [Moniliophthora roreri MCA 2997]|nr:wd-40 repeat protein [Moniliophthora roreri MCA 2997]KAI3614810.1 wd-40 repeat protein [Moniliophthora roreri]